MSRRATTPIAKACKDIGKKFDWLAHEAGISAQKLRDAASKKPYRTLADTEFAKLSETLGVSIEWLKGNIPGEAMSLLGEPLKNEKSLNRWKKVREGIKALPENTKSHLADALAFSLMAVVRRAMMTAMMEGRIAQMIEFLSDKIMALELDLHPGIPATREPNMTDYGLSLIATKYHNDFLADLSDHRDGIPENLGKFVDQIFISLEGKCVFSPEIFSLREGKSISREEWLQEPTAEAMRVRDIIIELAFSPEEIERVDPAELLGMILRLRCPGKVRTAADPTPQNLQETKPTRSEAKMNDLSKAKKRVEGKGGSACKRTSPRLKRRWLVE